MEIAIEELSQAIAYKLQPFHDDEALWDAGDIAIYLRVSKKTVQNHILKMAGFPSYHAIRGSIKLYYAKDVREWARKR